MLVVGKRVVVKAHWTNWISVTYLKCLRMPQTTTAVWSKPLVSIRFLIASDLFLVGTTRTLAIPPVGNSFSYDYRTNRLESRCTIAWLVSLGLHSPTSNACIFILWLRFLSAIVMPEVCSWHKFQACPTKLLHICYVRVTPDVGQKDYISLGTYSRRIYSEIHPFLPVL